jgi:hypothetical protein
VRLEVIDVSGRLVRNLAGGAALDAGSHTVVWDARDERGEALESGLYLVRLNAGGVVRISRMVLVK